MAAVDHSVKNGAQQPDSGQIAVKNPITDTVIGHIPVTSPEEVAAAVERGRFAQRIWAARPIKERAALLRDWGDLLWEDQENAIRVIRRETGKPDGGAFIEMVGTDNVVDYYVKNAASILRPQKRKTLFPFVHQGTVHYKPHGVVGIVSPWNYPFLLPFIDIIPALIAGNTVLLKPSEITPFSAQYGVDKMHEAGIPRDVIQLVQGDGSTGAALVEHVDYIGFTGSTATGRKVARRAAERLIPYSMELGGKDPSLVLADADLEITASSLLRSAFENAGQVCISIERAYVEAPVYDTLIERIQHYAQQLNLGAGDGMNVHVGSMTNIRELERTEEHISDALAKGARLLYGGKRRPDLGPLFYEPTVLVDVNHDMLVMREETFGPILPIMKVRDVDEAVRLANDSEYGLSASIFSRDLKRAERIALRIDSGDVSINRPQFVVGTPSLPMGGQRDSGVGRRNGPEGLLKYVHTQSILSDNLFAQKPELSLADPLSIRILFALRKLRRYIPFL